MLIVVLDKSRVYAFSRNYQLYLERKPSAHSSVPLKRVFPAYLELVRIRETLLHEAGRVAVRLDYDGNRAVLQRVAEILYPIELREDAEYVLRVTKDPDLRVSLVGRPK